VVIAKGIEMRAGFILGLLGVMFLAGCTTPSRVHVFEPTRAGAMAAGERILALPQGMRGEFVAHRRPEPTLGPFAEFHYVSHIPHGALERNNQGGFDRLCRSMRQANDCDPDAVIAAVFVLDRSSDTGPGVVFEPTVAGIGAAEAYARDDENFSPRRTARLMVEVEPDPPSTSFRWTWVRFRPQFIQADYVCSMQSWVRCIHRRDVGRLAILSFDAREVLEFVPVGEDLQASYQTALSRAEALNGSVRAEMKLPSAMARLSASLYTVDSVDDIGICGQISSSGLLVSGHQCLAFDDIQRFEVRDRMRAPHEAALDLATSPFRFLGAIAGATAMGGAGG
jgi:hypothetical protein